VPLRGEISDYDPLLDMIEDADFELLGEASHGTAEFYRTRAEITRRLITEKEFTAVAVEADWPDAYRVNRFVQGASSDQDASSALTGFTRFPTWMWRNTEVRDFVTWMRSYNDTLPSGARKAGFYGLDLYSLHTSIQVVLEYLDRVDPEAANRARERYSCFDHYGYDSRVYGQLASFGLTQSCEKEVVRQLQDLQVHAGELARRDGTIAEEDFFDAEQNARLARDAEAYYRSMFSARVSSWNLRDKHMADTLEELRKHLSRGHRQAKIVVWAHNSHIGDARATDMGIEGELNLGQLVREQHGQDAVLIGFSTFSGTVTAAPHWDEPPQKMAVRPAMSGSFEMLLHYVDLPNFMLPIRSADVAEVLRDRRLERAIGVVYRPHTERISHYFNATLADQFDAVVHFDATSAVIPLDLGVHWEPGEEAPEAFPSAV
ncbi:MAG: erythromycin esterase-like enzyme, partial [Chloroflexi bacterium]|nr:erythromycin esterase-like enzyme [Chloroflexota bacterium]